jgi:hypothetical protein
MHAFVCLVLLVLPGWLNFDSQEKKPYRIEVVAVAVAQDRVLLLGQLSAGQPALEGFILRIVEPTALERESRYIKLYYQHYSNEPLLPKDFFGEEKKLWRLTMARVYECDGTMRQMATLHNKEGESTFNAELLPRSADPPNPEVLPLDTQLPCFLLESKYVSAMRVVN